MVPRCVLWRNWCWRYQVIENLKIKVRNLWNVSCCLLKPPNFRRYWQAHIISYRQTGITGYREIRINILEICVQGICRITQISEISHWRRGIWQEKTGESEDEESDKYKGMITSSWWSKDLDFHGVLGGISCMQKVPLSFTSDTCRSNHRTIRWTLDMWKFQIWGRAVSKLCIHPEEGVLDTWTGEKFG